MGALLAVAGTSLGGWYFLGRRHGARPDLILHKIKKEKLQITITERGSLEPADNTFFTCKVKSKTPGGAATSIRGVIDNGSLVKKGDKILELDDSALQDQRDQQKILVYQAKADWKQADLTLTINRLTNEALVGTNQTKVEVSKIILDEYLNGLYVQLRLDLQNKYDMSQSDLFMWQERSVWSERMSRPERGYVTVSQAEADEARHKTAELTVQNFKTQLHVLDKFTREKFRTQYQGDIDEWSRQVRLAQEKLEKQVSLDDAVLRAKYAIYQTQLSRLQEIEREIDDCIIRAPRDGMVVYYVEERARFGQAKGMIANGELVSEGQKLIAVPDMKRMVVNARIHEAMYDKVSKGADRIRQTGFSDTIKGLLALNPQPLDGLFAYAAFELDMEPAFTNEHADEEKILERPGLDAVVRVNAFPDRPLKGHVKFVAPAPSQTDFFNSDVKVYQTYIAVDDESMEGLRPGMDAVVTINVDSTPEPVLTIPLQALLGGADMANKRRCFVMVDGHPAMRDITLGKANETLAEIVEGLQEGDEVVLNPSLLLSDKEKVKYGVSASSSRGGPGAGQGGGRGMGKGGRGKSGRGKSGPNGMQGGPGMPGGAPGMRGGPRSQGGAAPGGKAAASP